MGVVAALSGVVESVEEGRLRGQKIARVKADDGEIVFDLVEGVIDLVEGERVTIELHDEKPANLEEYSFCGHGFIVKPEDEAGKTIISIWGLLFVFPKPLGLVDGVKYYVCLRRAA